MKKRLLSGLETGASIVGGLCAIACCLFAFALICAVAELLGLYNFRLVGGHGFWMVLFLLTGLLVFALLRAAFQRLSKWALDSLYEIYERENQQRRQKQEDRQRAQEAEYQAWLAAMTPEERQRFDEDLARTRKRREEEEARRKAQPIVLDAEAWRRIDAKVSRMTGTGAGTSRSRLHDELDAAAHAQEITRVYGPDWKGYDPEAPGPDPESYGPDPETYPTDIW